MKVINTTAFVFALAVTIGYYFFLRRKWKVKNDKTMIPKTEMIINQMSKDQHEIFLPSALVDIDGGEDCLIAVITAAIHESTGTGDFEVVRITPSAKNWTLTGRQNLVSNGSK